MADIFLSYAREDLAHASHLAMVLAGRGWSVFWDRRIPTGKSFDQIIEQELDIARCVIVLWSQHSVVSDWVKVEASEGARRGILYPVWIEDVRIPLEFRRLQTARLVDWQPGTNHTEFDQLLADITHALGPAPIEQKSSTEQTLPGSDRITVAGHEFKIHRRSRPLQDEAEGAGSDPIDMGTGARRPLRPELAEHIQGRASTATPPKQTILAEIIKNADAELWSRFSSGGGGGNEWKQGSAASAVRELRTDELEAAVRISQMWIGQREKAWDSELMDVISRTTQTGDAAARRVIKSLVDRGFLEQANDLDYSQQPENAWFAGSIMWILRRAALRSGLFPALPPPLPERLSSLLADERPILITGPGWYAVRFAEPARIAFDARETALIGVGRLADRACTWAFRSADDRAPLKADQYFTPTGFTEDPFASLRGEREHQLLGFDLATFDDLGLLH